MLFGDRSKYLSMIIGLTFSALIMTQQPSIFLGLMTRTYSFITETSLADVWVMDPGVQFVEENKPLREIELLKVKGVEGVEWAVPLYKSLLGTKLPDGKMRTIDITAIDHVTLIGAPTKVLTNNLIDLKRPDAVFIDYEAATNQLKVTNADGSTRPLALGDILQINDKRAIVVGFVKAMRNFVLQPKIYMTYSQAKHYSRGVRKSLTYILVKAKPGVKPQDLVHRIKQQTGLTAYIKDDFSSLTLNYWMENTGVPINFGISVFLGFLVGAAVAGQTFYNFVSDNIKQYASLKAMGLRDNLLRNMILSQALVVGVVGYGIGVGLSVIFGLVFFDSVLAFRFDPRILIFAGCGILTIICCSALAAIRKVTHTDPAIVFRG
jgi:putative ABC transport system permease protein